MGMVQVILLKNVDSLGEMGKVVQVASGYARNYLIPNHIAAIATTKLVKQFEHSKRVVEAKISKTRKVAEGLARQINHTKLTLIHRAGPEGKLFGSVTPAEIVEALGKKNIEIDRKQVLMPSPIKEVGKHKVDIRLFQDIKGQVLVEVMGESVEEPKESPKPAE
jgi:large subunit ribosomal protein L9